MIQLFRIENPVFLNAVEFVGRKFAPFVICGGPWREDFHHESRRKCRMGFVEAGNLSLREIGKIRHECLTNTETDRDRFPV